MRGLIAVDLGAAGAEWIVDRAVEYAARIGAPLDVAHYLGGGVPTEELRARTQDLSTRIPVAIRGQWRLDVRPAEEGLLEATASYDLVVIGAREMGALERLLHGAMTQRVLAHTTCPVLIPRGERGPGRFPRILVGVDLDGPAPDHVLRNADRWADWLDGKVQPVNAFETHFADWMGHRDAVHARLDALVAQHVADGRRGTSFVRRGVPEDVLEEMSPDFDLLLVGNRERQGLARVALGSVATAVVRRAQCDVVVLPTATRST